MGSAFCFGIDFKTGYENGMKKAELNPTYKELEEWENKYNAADDKGKQRLYDERPKIVDPLGMVVDNPDLLFQLGPNSSVGKYIITETFTRGRDWHWDQINEEEKKIYYFWLDRVGTDKALEYLDFIQKGFGQRWEEKYTQDIADAIDYFNIFDRAAEKTEIKPLKTYFNFRAAMSELNLNLALTPLKWLSEGTAFAQDRVDYLFGNESNPYKEENASRFIFKGVQQKGAQSAKEIGDVNIPFTSKNIFEFSYNLTQNMAESSVGAALLRPFYSVVAGMGAANQAAEDAFDRGGTNNEVFFSGLAAGISEVLFEYVSIESLLKNKDDFIPTLKNFLLKKLSLQGAVEGSEEFFTELSTKIADRVIMGGKSVYNLRIKELMDENSSMTAEKASKKAFVEQFKDVMWATASGFLSGSGQMAIMGTPSIISSYYNKSKVTRAINMNIGQTIKKMPDANAVLEYARNRKISGVYKNTTIDTISDEILGQVGNKVHDDIAKRIDSADSLDEVQVVMDEVQTKYNSITLTGWAAESFYKRLADNPEWRMQTTSMDIDKIDELKYNEKRGDGYARTDEFRSLQAESQGMSDEDIQLYHSGSRQIDAELRGNITRIFRSQINSYRNGLRNDNELLRLEAKGNIFNLHQNIDGSLFHDIFEISRKYLKNGELVDLHGIETTNDGIGYNDCYNYLSEDGLSGFSITPDGDLISVFNASGKAGFLSAIAPIVKAKAKTLDCYNSPNQPLKGMYEKIFSFKTASIMDYNMEFDHDNIAENHGTPQIAFMVNTEAEVETKEFLKDEYDDAVSYRNSFIDRADLTDEAAFFMPETDEAQSKSDVDNILAFRKGLGSEVVDSQANDTRQLNSLSGEAGLKDSAFSLPETLGESAGSRVDGAFYNNLTAGLRGEKTVDADGEAEVTVNDLSENVDENIDKNSENFEKDLENGQDVEYNKNKGSVDGGLDNLPQRNTRNMRLEGTEHPKTKIFFKKFKTVVEGVEYAVVMPAFEFAYEAEVPVEQYKKGNYVHNGIANQQLKAAVENDPKLAAQFTDSQINDIKNGRTPSGYAWHHAAEPGKLQLVDSKIHSRTGHTGGRKFWG